MQQLRKAVPSVSLQEYLFKANLWPRNGVLFGFEEKAWGNFRETITLGPFPNPFTKRTEQIEFGLIDTENSEKNVPVFKLPGREFVSLGILPVRGILRDLQNQHFYFHLYHPTGPRSEGEASFSDMIKSMNLRRKLEEKGIDIDLRVDLNSDTPTNVLGKVEIFALGRVDIVGPVMEGGARFSVEFVKYRDHIMVSASGIGRLQEEVVTAAIDRGVSSDRYLFAELRDK